ncbi:MAG: DUF2709 domain-containing protein [Chlamydiia bacterium]|nr:DUF2709 domain-containing protein [Chlamydiia bacterium]
MTSFIVNPSIRQDLLNYLRKHRSVELLTAYLYFLERKLGLKPVVFVKDKVIFSSEKEAISLLEKEGKVWRETEIKIGVGPPSVNEQTKKIYICPFTGKAFGDNTHPNPQDAIYDWVSKCPENVERIGGVKAKRFFVSEDPEVIKNYIKPQKTPVAKIVYSSAVTGKLFNKKEAVIKDFRDNYLKPITLVDVQNQNRFQMHKVFLGMIESQLLEEKISAFVEELAELEDFLPYVQKWIEE